MTVYSFASPLTHHFNNLTFAFTVSSQLQREIQWPVIVSELNCVRQEEIERRRQIGAFRFIWIRLRVELVQQAAESRGRIASALLWRSPSVPENPKRIAVFAL